MASKRTKTTKHAPTADSTPPQAPDVEPGSPASGRRYATFTVELLLDNDGIPRRTQATHIQTGSEETWAGWNAGQLVDFVERQAEFKAPALPPAFAPTAMPFLATPSQPAREVAVTLQELTVADTDNAPRNSLRRGEPYQLRLRLQRSAALVAEPSIYRASIYARGLGEDSRQLLAETSDVLPADDTINVGVAELYLAPGVYRLEALLVASSPQAGQAELTTFLEGGLLHVY